MFPEVPGTPGAQIGRRLLDSQHRIAQNSLKWTKNLVLGVLVVANFDYEVQNVPRGTWGPGRPDRMSSPGLMSRNCPNDPKFYTRGFSGSLNTRMSFKMFPKVPGAHGAQIGRRLLDSYHKTAQNDPIIYSWGFCAR